MHEVDHRILGSRLELFHQQEEGPGMVFWHPRGWQLYRIIEDYLRTQMRNANFQEVRTPQLLARSLWERSGHWERFGKNMYSLVDAESRRPHCLKPMSCPCHIQLFNQRVRSYNDLPLRYSEFGNCHRDEPSGSIQGLMRTRAFVQDDAHVLCTEAHLATEVGRFCRLLRVTYENFGFRDFRVVFATRPILRMGADETWDRAEEALANAASAAELAFEIQEGEGAFYGPKLEFHLKDSRGRNWQCGTVQVDFVLPQRLDASFVNERGQHETPIMIHHAILGSMERFIGILLEHYDGWLPVWLAPEQVVVATVTSSDLAYALEVVSALEGAGIRVALDDRAERLGKKIVDAREKCISLMAVVGARDALKRTISLRRRNGVQEAAPLGDALALLQRECASP
jgi:threonyl-tRNA synthetase